MKERLLALLKQNPKNTAIVGGSTLMAIAVFSASGDEGAGGFGFGLGGGGLQSHEIYDHNGPAGRVVCAKVKAPSGWKFDGGVTWGKARGGDYEFKLTGTSADGRDRIEVHPTSTWDSANSGQHAPNIGPGKDAVSVVKNLFLPQLRRGAQVIKVDRPKELQDLIAPTVQGLQQVSAMSGGRGATGDAALIEIEYEEGGERYREHIVSLLATARIGDPNSQDSMMMRQMGMPAMFSELYTSDIMTIRAPASEFESKDDTLGKILSDIEINPQWQAMANRHRSQKSAQQHQSNMARLKSSHANHQANMASRNAAFESSQAAYRDTQRSNDASHRRWLNGHLGQADFHNPHSGQMETHQDTGQMHWGNGFGERITTDDTGWDPRNDPRFMNGGYEQLQRW